MRPGTGLRVIAASGALLAACSGADGDPTIAEPAGIEIAGELNPETGEFTPTPTATPEVEPEVVETVGVFVTDACSDDAEKHFNAEPVSLTSTNGTEPGIFTKLVQVEPAELDTLQDGEQVGEACEIDLTEMTINGQTAQAVVTPTPVAEPTAEPTVEPTVEVEPEFDPFANLTEAEMEHWAALVNYTNENVPVDLREIVDELGAIYLDTEGLYLAEHPRCNIPGLTTNMVMIKGKDDKFEFACGYDSATGSYYLDDYLQKHNGGADVNEGQPGSCQGPGVVEDRAVIIVARNSVSGNTYALEATCVISLPGSEQLGYGSPLRPN